MTENNKETYEVAKEISASVNRWKISYVVGALSALIPLLTLKMFGYLAIHWAFVIYTIGWISSAVIGIPLTRKIYYILKERHFEVWVDMGAPSLFLNNSIGNSLAMQRFVTSGSFEKLNDPELSSMCRKWRLINAWFLSFTAVSFVVFMLLIRASQLQH